MKVVYFDCFSGISGDMSLAALINAGANIDFIEKELKRLPIEPFEIQLKQVVKKGVTALKLDVVVDPTIQLVHHRHYTDIIGMIDESEMPESVKVKAKKIFERIGIAEAKVHNIPLEKVHFHEVGAVDSIVDIIGVALALYDLDIHQVYTSPIPLGSGQIKIDHGVYPIPTPATLEILKGLPVRSSNIKAEMTTPTGAGIIAALGNGFEGFPSMTVEAIGYGAGTKDFPDRPNVLRAVIGTIDELTLSNSPYQIHHHQHHQHHQEHQHPHAK